jgi:hypothetical protein
LEWPFSRRFHRALTDIDGVNAPVASLARMGRVHRSRLKNVDSAGVWPKGIIPVAAKSGRAVGQRAGPAAENAIRCADREVDSTICVLVRYCSRMLAVDGGRFREGRC